MDIKKPKNNIAEYLRLSGTMNSVEFKGACPLIYEQKL